MWSGASGTHFWMSFFAAAVIFAGAENLSPPCTTRWPIASISARLFTTPHAGSHRTDITCAMASTWFFIGTSRTVLSQPVFV